MPVLKISHVQVPSAALQLMRGVASFFLLAIADLCAWYIAYQLAVTLAPVSAIKFAIMAAAWSAWAAFVRNQYSRRYSFWTELGLIIQGVSMLAFVGGMLKALIGHTDSLWIWFVACMVLLVLVPILRALVRTLLGAVDWWSRATIVFGGGENAREAVLALHAEPSMGYKVSAQVWQTDLRLDDEAKTKDLVQVAWPSSLDEFEKLRLFQCVIALEAHEFELRDALLRQLSLHQVQHLHVIPAMRGVPLFGLASTNFFSHEVLMIHVRNNLLNPLHRWAKRLFDLLGALCLIILLSPVMLLIAYKIWRIDGGPVIFSQYRVGKGLRIFNFYKFRSMKKNAEEMLKCWEINNSPEWQEYTVNNFKLANDPRLIGIGAMIRRTSIDELPQLFNVIKGDMSLVGPRPLLPREQYDYGDDLCLYAQTPPGLTGLWQISGRSQTTFSDRVAFDAWYIKNWSIWTDISILFKTIKVVSGRQGAY